MRMFRDTAAGGSLVKKGSSKAMEIIESMAVTSYQWPSERVQLKKIAAASSSDPMALISTQLAEMNSRIAALTLGNPEPAVEIPTSVEDANYINGRNYGNFQHGQQGGYNSGQRFHHGGRPHPNLAYGNLNNVIQPPLSFSVTNGVINEEKKPNIDELLMKFMSKSDEMMEKLESNATTIVDLPSGTTQEGPKTAEYESAPPSEEVTVEVSGKKKDEKQKATSLATVTIPFPQRHKKERMKERLSKFLEIFKKVNINVPLVEMLLEMPQYAKFLKDIVSRKKKLGEFETMRLNEECSAILQRKLPAKNPGDQKFLDGDLDEKHGAGSSWSQHCLYQPP
ncbi:uncharacterized protein LOC131002758 [Salvia miltiorrhiza]|uniref:uncharacterized protein LOC131002758 n=1 Tax=Salvia miltiorrhiza TaxID=226208 RepID=UPI0025AC975C|nr:uncharacterized protein LOC131002758 [Salvia miltiorrhiza]